MTRGIYQWTATIAISLCIKYPLTKTHQTNFGSSRGQNVSELFKHTRGETEITLTSALKAGYKLIAKLRLPHIEWEGEEVDYISMPTYILNEGESIPKPIVLLYNPGTDTATGSRLAQVLENLNIEVKNITGDLLGEEVGYLAELDGFEASGETYKGDSFDTQFMLMCKSRRSSFG